MDELLKKDAEFTSFCKSMKPTKTDIITGIQLLKEIRNMSHALTGEDLEIWNRTKKDAYQVIENVYNELQKQLDEGKKVSPEGFIKLIESVMKFSSVQGDLVHYIDDLSLFKEKLEALRVSEERINLFFQAVFRVHKTLLGESLPRMQNKLEMDEEYSQYLKNYFGVKEEEKENLEDHIFQASELFGLDQEDSFYEYPPSLFQTNMGNPSLDLSRYTLEEPSIEEVLENPSEKIVEPVLEDKGISYTVKASMAPIQVDKEYVIKGTILSLGAIDLNIFLPKEKPVLEVPAVPKGISLDVHIHDIFTLKTTALEFREMPQQKEKKVIPFDNSNYPTYRLDTPQKIMAMITWDNKLHMPEIYYSDDKVIEALQRGDDLLGVKSEFGNYYFIDDIYCVPDRKEGITL